MSDGLMGAVASGADHHLSAGPRCDHTYDRCNSLWAWTITKKMCKAPAWRAVSRLATGIKGHTVGSPRAGCDGEARIARAQLPQLHAALRVGGRRLMPLHAYIFTVYTNVYS